MVTVIPYLTIVVCVVAGVYISWHQGSHGGGIGGVIGGIAFLVAAIIRLALPRKLAGFLASRNRATDVATLAAFGACLLLLGLLLPRLPVSPSAKHRHWPNTALGPVRITGEAQRSE
jgi:multisubunit Na+/H+ antiporter MnhB subunit